MFIELRDGVAYFATHKITIRSKKIDLIPDEKGILQEKERLIMDIVYALSEEEKNTILSQYDDCIVEVIEQPIQKIIDRAESLKGKTFSKSEFETMLLEKTPDELKDEQIALMQKALDDLIMGGVI
jgi:hypothetical protein